MTPTRFDYAPCGQICRVINETNSFFVQVADSEEETRWEPVATVLAEVLSNLFDDEEFIDELMHLYLDKERPVYKLCKIIETKDRERGIL